MRMGGAAAPGISVTLCDGLVAAGSLIFGFACSGSGPDRFQIQAFCGPCKLWTSTLAFTNVIGAHLRLRPWP